MALRWSNPEDLERGRRRLLSDADRILDDVEELRLGDTRAVPAELTLAIENLQRRLGRRGTAPTTLAAAHRLLLALEGRLMGANPRFPKTRAHTDRPAGQPIVRVLRGGLTWKLLTLPAAPPAGPDAVWYDLLDATVDRACERWLYAQAQAIRAARERCGAGPAWSRARAAWDNYWALRSEAEDLRRRAARRPART